MMNEIQRVLVSKQLDDILCDWILTAISNDGVYYDDLVNLVSPKIKLDYFNSLLTKLNNQNQIVFITKKRGEFIVLNLGDNLDGLLL